MIAENRGLFFIAPAAALGPGLLLASLVVGINLLTKALRGWSAAPCRERNKLI
jgi:ABC-type dipeptide/oligopeptide/nickel transport system permease subunit